MVLPFRADDSVGLDGSLRRTRATGDAEPFGHQAPHQARMARLVGGNACRIELLGITHRHFLPHMSNELQVNHTGIELVEVHHQRTVGQLVHVGAGHRRKATARLHHCGLEVAHVFLRHQRQLGATGA